MCCRLFSFITTITLLLQVTAAGIVNKNILPSPFRPHQESTTQQPPSWELSGGVSWVKHGTGGEMQRASLSRPCSGKTGKWHMRTWETVQTSHSWESSCFVGFWDHTVTAQEFKDFLHTTSSLLHCLQHSLIACFFFHDITQGNHQAMSTCGWLEGTYTKSWLSSAWFSPKKGTL